MSQASKTERTLALSLVALGVILRLWIRTPTDFWEDEIIASTHAVQPFWQIPIETLRNDVHPPLFFLQLHIWGWLGHSDLWLTLNPLAWGLAAIFSIWFVATRLYGERTGLLAAAVFAVCPSPAFLADQLRMYSMLVTLIIWAFYLTVRLFRDRHRTVATIAGLELLLLAIVNTHAIGFLAVLLDGLYALHLILSRPRPRPIPWLWLGLYGFAALAALPWLVSGVLHDANLPEKGGLATIAHALAAETLGEIVYGSPIFLSLGVLAYCALVAVGLQSRRTRALTLTFLILPPALSIAAALCFKPIFKWNIFSTMAAPFIALVAARLLTRPAKEYGFRNAVPAALVLLLVAASVTTRFTHSVSSGFRDRANLILANYLPGDLVYAPQQSVFWGAAWYLDGPDWGSPLAIAAAPSPQWRAVYRRLGPGLTKRLHLMPGTQLLEHGGIRMLAGNESAGQAAGATRVWLLSMPRADLKAGFPPSSLNGLPAQWTDHTHTWVTLYARRPQKIAVPATLVRH